MKLLILLLLAGITSIGITIDASEYKAVDSAVGEIIELRGEKLKVFALKDGTYEYRYYTNPVHYWTGNSMKEISDLKDSNSNILYNMSKNVIQNFNYQISNTHVYKKVLTNSNFSNKMFYKNFKQENKQTNK